MDNKVIRSTILLTAILLPFCLFVDDGQAGVGVNAPGAAEVDSFFFITSLAKSGRASAQVILGEMHLAGHGVPENHVEALRWFRAAAEQGDAEALRRLGFMYESGFGVKRDLVQAETLYRRAANSGDLLSSFLFGFNYVGTNIP